jgi:hypothetical protein
LKNKGAAGPGIREADGGRNSGGTSKAIQKSVCDDPQKSGIIWSAGKRVNIKGGYAFWKNMLFVLKTKLMSPKNLIFLKNQK